MERGREKGAGEEGEEVSSDVRAARVDKETCVADRTGKHTTLRIVDANGPQPDPRYPGHDPDGARQVAAVKALLRLGAGLQPPPLFLRKVEILCCHRADRRLTLGPGERRYTGEALRRGGDGSFGGYLRWAGS